MPSDAAAASKALRGVLCRGATPGELHLELLSFDLDAVTRLILGSAVLSAFRDLAPRLTHLTLSCVPLTEATVGLIQEAAPCLSSLRLLRYNCASQDGDAAGLPALLTHVSPHLQQLALHDVRPFEDRDRDRGWTPAVASALQQCTSVKSIEVSCPQPHANVLESLAALSQLRSLTLNVSEDNDFVVPAVVTKLLNLTGLTQLAVQDYGNLVGQLLPGAAAFTSLHSLDIPRATLCPTLLRGLAELSSLTRLAASAYNTPLAAYPVGSVPLPPRLRELHLNGYQDARALASLQAPATLTRLQLSHIVLDRTAALVDLVSEEELGEAVLGACRLLAGRYQDQGASHPLFVNLGSWDPGRDGLWPDGLARMWAALAPARLRRLKLLVGLAAPDMASLAEQLTTLEELRLMCAPGYTLAAVPALRRLPRLAVLELAPNAYPLDAGAWTNPEAIRAALAPLCLEAPALRRLALGLSYMPSIHDDAVAGAFEQAKQALKEEMRLHGRAGVEVVSVILG